MLSMHDNPALVEMALDRGASGFLSKRCKPEDLITAVRTVAGGGVYLMPEIAQQLARVRVDPLTRREREIALLLAQGGGARDRRRLGAVAEDGACASRQSVRQAGYQQ